MPSTQPLKRLLIKQGDITSMLESRNRAYSKTLFDSLAAVCIGRSRRYSLSYVEGVIAGVRGLLDKHSIRRFNETTEGKRLLEQALQEWQQRVDLYAMTHSQSSPQGYLGLREACQLLGMSEGYLGQRGITAYVLDDARCFLPGDVIALCQWPAQK